MARPKHRVRMILKDGAGAAHHTVDLVLTPGGPPLAVLEWMDYPNGTSVPSVALELDPALLHPLTPGWAPETHMYEKQMNSPIPLPRG